MPRGSFKTAKLMTAATQTKAASSRLFKKSGGIGANRSHGNGRPRLTGQTYADLGGRRRNSSACAYSIRYLSKKARTSFISIMR